MDSLPRWLVEDDTSSQCDNTFENTNVFRPVLSARGLSQVTRFGASSSFSSLFSSNSEDQAGYVAGLIYFGAIFLVIFIVWIILLIVFKVMGPGNAGFLSGYHFVEPDPRFERKPYRTPTIVRSVFVFCAVLVITFAVVMVTEGYDNLQNFFVNMDNSTVQVLNLLEDAQEILDIVVTVGMDSVDVGNTLTQTLDNFCPTFDLEGELGINFDELTSSATSDLDQIDSAIDFIDDGGELLGELIDKLEKVQDIKEGIDLRDWYMMVYVIPLIVFTSLLMMSTILAWMDSSFQWYQRTSTYVIFPIFFVFVVVGSIVAVVLAIVSVANADICTGGAGNPSIEGTIMDILDLRKIDFGQDSIVFRSIVFYTQGCQSGRDPFDFLTDHETTLIETRDVILELQLEIDNVGVERLGLLCGIDFGPTRTLISRILTNINTLIDAVFKVKSLICCERINRIYVAVAQQGACNFSVTGLTWFFSSLLIIGACGMTMSMFRAAWLDVEYATGDEILEQPISKEDNPMARYKSSIVEVEDNPMTRYKSSIVSSGVAGAGLAQSAEYGDNYNEEHSVDDSQEGRPFVGDESYEPSSTKSWEKYPIGGLSQDPPVDHDDVNDDTYNEEDFHKYDEEEEHVYDGGEDNETKDQEYVKDNRDDDDK